MVATLFVGPPEESTVSVLRPPQAIEIPVWIPEPWMIDDERREAPREAPYLEEPPYPAEPAPPASVDESVPRGVLILDI